MMRLLATRVLFPLCAFMAALFLQASEAEIFDPLDILGLPTQKAYPENTSLYAKVAHLSQVLNREDKKGESFSQTVLHSLGTLRLQEDYSAVADKVSVYAVLARIQKGVDDVDLLYPASYEAALRRAQALLGSPQDTSSASTAMGYLNEVIALVAHSSGDEEARWGDFGYDLGQSSFLQCLRSALYSLTLEPLLGPGIVGDEAAEGEETNLGTALQNLSASLQQCAPASLVRAFGTEDSGEPALETLLGTWNWTQQLLQSFASFSTQEDIGILQKLVGTAQDNSTESTLWGMVKKAQGLLQEQQPGWEEQWVQLFQSTESTSAQKNFLSVLKEVQQQVTDVLVECLVGSSWEANVAPSCSALCKTLKRLTSSRATLAFQQEWEHMALRVEDIASQLLESASGFTFDPVQFPFAVHNLWRQLYNAQVTFRSGESMDLLFGEETDGPEKTTLRGTMARLAQSFYLPPWRRQLGEVLNPDKGTLLFRLRSLGNNLILREGYDEVLKAPYFGHVILDELSDPGTFFHRVVLLRSALEASLSCLDALWGERIQSCLGEDPSPSTTTLSGLVTMMESAFEADDVGRLKELSLAGRALVDDLLFALHKTVLPKTLGDVHERFQQWVQKNSSVFLKASSECLQEISSFQFGSLAKSFSVEESTYLPEFVAYVYDLLGTPDSTQSTSLLGLMAELEDDVAVWPSLVGEAQDRTPADGYTLHGIENSLKDKLGLSSDSVEGSRAPTVCSCFQVGWELSHLAAEMGQLSSGLESLGAQLLNVVLSHLSEKQTGKALKNIQSLVGRLGKIFQEWTYIYKQNIEERAQQEEDNSKKCLSHRSLPSLRGVRGLCHELISAIATLLNAEDPVHSCGVGSLESVRILPGEEGAYLSSSLKDVIQQLGTLTERLSALKVAFDTVPFFPVPSSWDSFVVHLAEANTLLASSFQVFTSTPLETCQSTLDETLREDLAKRLTSFQGVLQEPPHLEKLCCSVTAFHIDRLAFFIQTLATSLRKMFMEGGVDLDADIRSHKIDPLAETLVSLGQSVLQRLSGLQEILKGSLPSMRCQSSQADSVLRGMLTDFQYALRALHDYAPEFVHVDGLSIEEPEIQRTFRCGDMSSCLLAVGNALRGLQRVLISRDGESILSVLKASSSLSYNPVLVGALTSFHELCGDLGQTLRNMKLLPSLCSCEGCSWQAEVDSLSKVCCTMKVAARLLGKELQRPRCCSSLAQAMMRLRQVGTTVTNHLTFLLEGLMEGSFEVDVENVLQGLAQSWQEMADELRQVTHDMRCLSFETMSTCCCAKPLELHVTALGDILGRLEEALDAVASLQEDSIPSQTAESPSVTEELNRLSSVTLQWKNLFQRLACWAYKKIWGESKEDVMSLGNVFLPLMAQIDNVEEAMQGVDSLLQDFALREVNLCQATPSTSLAPSLRQLSRDVTSMRISLESLNNGNEQARQQVLTESVQKVLHHSSLSWFLGEDDTVFYRHKGRPTLFLRWSLEKESGEGVYDDGETRVVTDPRGYILEGRCAGCNVADFEPISLVSILQQIANVSEATQRDIKVGLKIFGLSLNY